MFKIVDRRFTPAEFAAYVAGIKLTESFRPQFVVIHNTGVPSLDQRKQGWTAQAVRVLHEFYAKTRKWNGAPHSFIDDREDGIVVFNPLDRRGTHSPSFNGRAWGLEMLGDFDGTDDPTTGRGAKVVQNTAHATAALLDKLGLTANKNTIRLHKEDPETDHACPGHLFDKDDFITMVRAIQQDRHEQDGAGNAASADSHKSQGDPGYRLLLNATDIGATWQNPADANRNYFPLRLLMNKIHGAAEVTKKLASGASGVSWDGKAIPAPVAVRDGVAFVQLAAVAAWQGLVMDRDINARTITLRKGAR